MSKKKNASKKARKAARKNTDKPLPEQPKPVRVTCETCGLEYDEGAPHGMFCRGTRETKCEECGAEMSDDVSVAACRGCGKVFCDNCGSVEDRSCEDCGG